ncbi:ABC transporter substrate-binding protein [Corticimicrobacter populi]|uniref:ABC transporter substrate-binding protein n=1 Tax=Corticimicrobacter populi TaxID=2175229 RepID=A0A2V1JYM7_9BURK|nr:ABC transporter substrate-binding protein [Corticimicrobacter populi]PWF23879.1 ABC transporter substrate-binding protein [Corticimicrobacter populi]
MFSLIRRVVAMVCLLLAGMAAAQAEPITVRDVLGREVTLPKPAERVVLTQARYLPVLSLIHPDPASVLAGWSNEFKTAFSNEYQDYLARFPALADVPEVARHTPDTFSIEKALALRPDLLILTSSFAGVPPGGDVSQSPLIKAFEAAGVPVLVVDFFLDPLNNTVPSIRALGQALGQSERAEAFIEFYESRMQRVRERVAQAQAEGKAPPNVLMHAHAGSTDCCNSPGFGTFNDLITFAGGHNIGSDTLKGPTGQLSIEYIVSRNPEVYVATGTGVRRGGVHMGAGITPEQARESLDEVVGARGLSTLPAVRDGRAYGIWHAFNDSPLHMVFIEALAGWLDPERFADVSPQETLDIVNERFLAVPMRGTYLIKAGSDE